MPRQGPPPPGKKTKKEKQRERKAAGATEGTGQKRSGDGGDERPSKAAKTKEAANAGRRLFIGHCPQSLTEDSLRNLFANCGKCEVELQRRTNGRFKGICFVTFETAAETAAALKLNGSKLDGKSVVVQLASAPTESRGQQPVAVPSPSVFIANLTDGVDKAAVKGTMREFGTIKGVTLIRAAGGHAAFVDFATAEEAAKAVAAKSFARPLPGGTPRISFSRRDAEVVRAHSSQGRSQEAKVRRKGKRDEARGIVREPRAGHVPSAPSAQPKVSSVLNLRIAGSSEFAPPLAPALSAAPQKPISATPSSGPGKSRASSAKRAKLALRARAEAKAKAPLEK